MFCPICKDEMRHLRMDVYVCIICNKRFEIRVIQ
jgi:hypothetical protein